MNGELPQLHTDPLMRVSLFIWSIYAETYLRARLSRRKR